MSGIRDQENIDELKKRLYERGNDPSHIERHRLTRPDISVARGWDAVPETITPEPTAEVKGMEASTPTEAVPTLDLVKKPSRRYRLVILLASIALFIITAVGSGIYLFFGANQISASNISITVNTPIAVAGGDSLTMQINVSNQNSVAISEATVIINYPSGTRSIDESQKELFEERIVIDSVAAGEAINIPVRAILYGEENQEKVIKVAVEYKVDGSNGTFFKEADQQVVKISSSPLVVRVLGLETVASGQQVEVRLQLQSNSPTVQRNILVNASYPSSFLFVSADPAPDYSQNSWLISELKPESVYEIVVRGVVNGLANEVSQIQLQAGNPQLGNQFLMDSVVSQAQYSYTVEKPFTAVTVDINGDTDGEAIIQPGEDADVILTVTNTLDEAIYDMRVEIMPRGNLVRDNNLNTNTSRSFYDRTAGIIRFDVAGDSALEEIGPGESRTFNFSVKPDRNQQTASFSVSANIYARRVNASRAAETLIGTALSEAKYSSTVVLKNQIQYGSQNTIAAGGPSIIDSGAIPPVAEQATTYTVTLQAESGVNDVTDTLVTANLPQSVSFTNRFEGDGTLEFNPVSKQVRWSAGDISANSKKTVHFQVSLLPSITDVGSEAILVGTQSLSTTDRFTGVPLTAEAPEIYNRLSSEFGFIQGNGIIQAQ